MYLPQSMSAADVPPGWEPVPLGQPALIALGLLCSHGQGGSQEEQIPAAWQAAGTEITHGSDPRSSVQMAKVFAIYMVKSGR